MLKIDEIRNGTIWLSGDQPLTVGARTNEKDLDQDGILFIRKTSIDGIYTYGCEQVRTSYFGHGPGYIWSSRASVMNAAFSTVLYEAAYRQENRGYVSCAVDLVRIEGLLNEFGYNVDFTPHVSDDKVDCHFYIKKQED